VALCVGFSFFSVNLGFIGGFMWRLQKEPRVSNTNLPKRRQKVLHYSRLRLQVINPFLDAPIYKIYFIIRLLTSSYPPGGFQSTGEEQSDTRTLSITHWLRPSAGWATVTSAGNLLIFMHLSSIGAITSHVHTICGHCVLDSH
jgi:hypothetical protein